MARIILPDFILADIIQANSIFYPSAVLVLIIWLALVCSKCHEDHPAVYFNYQQREHGNSRTRTCIGRQGRMKVCSHGSLSWLDIESARQRSWNPMLSCTSSDHNGCPPQLMIENLATIDGAKSMKVSVHTSKEMFGIRHSETSTLRPPTATKILKDVSKNAEDAGDISLCPHTSFNSANWRMGPDPWLNRPRCDMRPDMNWLSRKFFSPRIDTTESSFDRDCLLCEVDATAEDSAIRCRFQGTSTHCDSCSKCQATYKWVFSSYKSSAQCSDILTLRVSREMTATKPTDHEWLSSLEITPGDPADARGDPDTEHMLWCGEPGCATFVNWKEVGRWAQGTT